MDILRVSSPNTLRGMRSTPVRFMPGTKAFDDAMAKALIGQDSSADVISSRQDKTSNTKPIDMEQMFSLMKSDSLNVNADEQFTLFTAEENNNHISPFYASQWEGVVDYGKGAFLQHFEDSGIDTSGTINWDADGSHTLTTEELAYLHAKYNIGALSPNDQYDLFCELAAMDALAGDDLATTHVPYILMFDIEKLKSDPNVVFYYVDPQTGEVTGVLYKYPDGEKGNGELRDWRSEPDKLGSDLIGYLMEVIAKRQFHPNGNLRDQDEIGASILQSQKKVLEILQMISEYKIEDEAGSGGD